ncbi:MAG: hypothetical protein QXU32_02715 [Nitrososphaerales archaeon]
MAEEIISMVMEKGEIAIGEIRNELNVTSETVVSEIDFLVRMGFLKLDKTKSYVRLSERCKKFLEEAEQEGSSIFLLI